MRTGLFLTVAELLYILAAALFIIGLKRLSSPATARSGNAMGAVGMLLAVIATLVAERILSPWAMIGGLAAGGAIGAVLAMRVQMTSMPQLVAVFNGFGGGASALVAGAEYLRTTEATPALDFAIIGVSVLIGALTFSGSVIAWAKLQEVMTGRPITYPGQKLVSGALLVVILLLGVDLVLVGSAPTAETSIAAGALGGGGGVLVALAVLSLVLGVLLVIPIGGADMPVVIALLNSYSGIAASATGFVLRNNMLIIAGALVGASGIILTRIMCQAMNRSLANVLFGAFGGGDETAGGGTATGGTVREFSPTDAAIAMSYAQRVVIVPGYGMAVAQAQHGVKELAELLSSKGVDVRFAVHPVAGRMPGHMNVLLAEAGVDYGRLKEMEEINPDLPHTDVVLVIGANDVVNPAARNDPGSPLYGMPIINVDEAQTVVVMKRSMRPGFAGVDNPLFYNENTRMLFGDAKDSVAKLVQETKAA